MSLSQIELCWVRVRVEWECFWVNLREDNKVSESKMAVAESSMAEFKMAAIFKLSQFEWMSEFLFCAKWLNPRWLSSSSWLRMYEFESDWISFNQSFVQNDWIKWWQNSRWQNSRWLPSSSWVRMNEWCFFVQMVGRGMWVIFFCANGGNQSWQVWVSIRGIDKMVESKMAKLNEFESDWISQSKSQRGVRVFLSESERR